MSQTNRITKEELENVTREQWSKIDKIMRVLGYNLKTRGWSGAKRAFESIIKRIGKIEPEGHWDHFHVFNLVVQTRNL